MASPPSYEASTGLAARVRNAADENASILFILSSAEDAVSSLENQTSYLQQLDRQLREASDRSQELDTALGGLRDLESKSRSGVRNAMSSLKFHKQRDTARSTSEDLNVRFQAFWQEQREVKARMAELQQLRKNAAQRIRVLERSVEQYKSAQKRLDSLYASVFDSSSGSIPSEGNLSLRLMDALRDLDDCRSKQQETKARIQALSTADTALGRFLICLTNRSDYPATDWETRRYLVERDSVPWRQRAKQHLNEVHSNLEEIGLSPEISPDISEQAFAGVVAKYPFRAHEKIWIPIIRAARASMRNVRNQIRVAEETSRACDNEIARATEQRDEAKQALREERIALFEQILSASRGPYSPANMSELPPPFES